MGIQSERAQAVSAFGVVQGEDWPGNRVVKESLDSRQAIVASSALTARGDGFGEVDEELVECDM